MSEYQYFEFRAIDRQLTDAEIKELGRYSSRAEITRNSFVVVYNYGDFRGDPKELLQKYFDAFIHVASWGTRWFMTRVPASLFNAGAATEFESGDGLSCMQVGEHVVLSFERQEEGGYGWEDGTEWMATLIHTRAALLRGDRRALYLGWLLGTESCEVEDDAFEPTVPPGLAELDEPLDCFAEFLRINPDLVVAASESSAALPSASLVRNRIAAWVSGLPPEERDGLLSGLIADDQPNLVAQLRQRALGSNFGDASLSSGPRRTVSELNERARVLGKARRAREAKERDRKMIEQQREAERKRKAHIESLRGKESEVWSTIDGLLASTSSKRYVDTVSLLVDLRELAELQGTQREFQAMVNAFRATHDRKPKLIERMINEGFFGQRRHR